MEDLGWNRELYGGGWVWRCPSEDYVLSKAGDDYLSGIERDPGKGPAIGGAMRDSV